MSRSCFTLLSYVSLSHSPRTPALIHLTRRRLTRRGVGNMRDGVASLAKVAPQSSPASHPPSTLQTSSLPFPLRRLKWDGLQVHIGFMHAQNAVRNTQTQRNRTLSIHQVHQVNNIMHTA